MHVDLTAPSLVLMCLIRSRENIMVDITIGRYSSPSFPDLIGVRSSSTEVLFNILHPKSDKELKINEKN
jgi:hypothetical protein